MFEKLRQLIDEGKNMLEEGFVVPDDADFIAVPPGVTEEELIEEAKEYVDAIIVTSRRGHHQNLVGVAAPEGSAEAGQSTGAEGPVKEPEYSSTGAGPEDQA